MPAATTKADLMDVTLKEWTKLADLIETVPEAAAMNKDDEDTSIKDIIAHRAHWIDLFLGWYADGQAGKEVHLPTRDYKWNDLKAYNRDLRERQADLSWQGARAQLDTAHTRLMTFLDARSDADLYAAPMLGGNNHWPAGRWAESAGPSHYRSAAKYIRARLRDLSA